MMTLDQLTRRIKATVREMRQVITDGESWNENNKHGHYLDLEADRVAANMAERALASLEAGNIAAGRKLWDELCSYMKKVGYG